MEHTVNKYLFIKKEVLRESGMAVLQRGAIPHIVPFILP